MKCLILLIIPVILVAFDLEFDDAEEDAKIKWEDVEPTSVLAMTRRINRLCQIIKWMDDTIAEDLQYFIEEEGPELLNHMKVYIMSIENLTEFIQEYTNITVKYGKSLLDRGPPKWIPYYFDEKMTFDRFNWTRVDLKQMYDYVEYGKRAYKTFQMQLDEKM